MDIAVATICSAFIGIASIALAAVIIEYYRR